MSKACPNKNSKEWLQLVKDVGIFEAYRTFIKNDYDVPKFHFKTKEDVIKYLDYLPQVTKSKGEYYIPYGETYGTWTTNRSLVKDEVKRINNVYGPLIIMDSKPVTRPNPRTPSRTYIDRLEVNEQALLDYYKIYEDPRELQKEAEDRGEIYVPNYEQRVAYNLKVTAALMDIKGIRNTIRLNTKDKPNIEQNLRKLLRGKGINDQQISFIFDYMKENDISAMNTEDLAIKLASEFAYTVESTLGIKGTGQSFEELKPSQYYANLTVPGGANYTENELKTPDITPSIKGHAQFATDQGIGWFRSDDSTSDGKGGFAWDTVEKDRTAKTRRVLELQSDLFQKGRDKKDLITGHEYEILERDNLFFIRDIYSDEDAVSQHTTKISAEKEVERLNSSTQNKFLQLLNKDSNWITFFINTIIQDSAKRGYEKVLFPKGETAAKVEGHETLADEIRRIDNDLKELGNPVIENQLRERNGKFTFTGNFLYTGSSKNDIRNKIEVKKSELKSQGIEKLKPIEAFYEIKVGNILKKIDSNIQTITDEHGNQWYEYTIKEGDLSKSFALQRPSDRLSPENRKDFEAKKAIMLKTFPRVTEVIEDHSMPQAGVLESNGTVIRVNPNLWTSDTIGHEFGHLLIDIMGGMSNPLIQKARKQLLGSDIEASVKERYADLVEAEDGRIDKEIVAQAVGEETASLFKTAKERSEWRKILDRIFDRIKKLLHIDSNVAKDLAKRVLSGESIHSEGEITVDTAEQRTAMEGLRAKFDKKKSTKTEIGKLRESAIKTLELKHARYKKQDVKNRLKKLEDTLAKIRELDADPVQSLKLFQQFAVEQTQQVYNKYTHGLRLKNKLERGMPGGKAFSLNDLTKWKDYVTGFSLLEELATMAEDIEVDVLKNNPELKSVLNKDALAEAVRQRNIIEKAYVTEGVDLAAKFLAPYSNHIEAEYKELLEKEYRALPKEEQAAITKADYLDKYLGENRSEINQKSKDLIKIELLKASKDVGLATRWLDNIMDSPDAVVSAMGQAFIETEHKSRTDFLEVQDEMLTKVKALEKYYEGKTGLNKDVKNIYDFMLEKDGDNYTQHITTAYKSKIWEDYEAFKAKLVEDGIPYDAQQDRLKKWKKDNMPVDSDNLNKAKDTFFDDLIAKGLITKGQKNELNRNDHWEVTDKKQPEEIVSDEAAEIIHDWFKENLWKYRLPVNYYRNKQWLDLVKMAGGNVDALISKQIEAVKANVTKDVRIDFYNFIMAQNEELQKGVPYGHRLHTRLPSVLKTSGERLQAGLGATSALKHTIKSSLNVLADESERGERILTDEAGEPVHFIPVYYTTDMNKYYGREYDELSDKEKGKINRKDYANQKAEENQSYDLGSIYARYFNSAISFKHKHAILPEMEMARFLAGNRNTNTRDGKGNIITDYFDRKKEGKAKNLSEQLNSWFEAVMYGMKEKDEGTINILGTSIDIGKGANLLNKYTAINLLGFNFITGTANVILGSTMQFLEASGGRHYTIKDWGKAKGIYSKHLPSIMGDIGRRKPTNTVSSLLREFNILNEYEMTEFRKDSKFAQLLTSNSVFFMSHMGEHLMQAQVLLAMLNNKQAKDKDGNVIGPMVDQFSMQDGKLTLNKDVANFTTKDRGQFEAKVRRLLTSLHGEYSDAGRVAVQRYALGRMAYMFRKFVIPGIRRRWQRQSINNGLGEYVEGNYRTTGRYFQMLLKDLKGLQFTMMATDWKNLSDRERTNIKRTLIEFSFMIGAVVLGHIFTQMKDDDDDDKWIWSFASYQALRFKTELWFFSNPSEAMKIMRSPAASMSVIENMIKLFGQMLPPDFDGLERYERGSWKGQYKVNKTLINFAPGLKQIYRTKYVGDQITWLKN